MQYIRAADNSEGACGCVIMPRSGLTPAQRKWTDKLFAAYDKDASGTITEEAFRKLLHLVDPEMDGDEMRGGDPQRRRSCSVSADCGSGTVQRPSKALFRREVSRQRPLTSAAWSSCWRRCLCADKSAGLISCMPA